VTGRAEEEPMSGTWRLRHVIVVICALILGACSSAGSSGEAEGPVSEAGGAPAADPTEISGEITVSLWDYGYPDPEAWLEDFNSVYPNVTVNLQNVDLTQYRQGLLLGLSSGTAADVVQLYESDIPQYQDVLEDLEPYAQQSWGEDWRSQFATGALDQMIVEDKVVAMPQYLAGPGSLFYNVGIFDELGLEPPTTYDELRDVAQTLRDNGYQALAHGARDAAFNQLFYRVLALQTSGEAQYEAATCQRPWTDDGLVEAMRLWGALFEDGVMSRDQLAQAQYPDAVDAFTTQQAGMLFNGTWHNFSMTEAGYQTYIDGRELPDPDQQYIWQPVAFPLLADGGTSQYAIGTHGWGISPESQNKEAAWAFVSWYSGQEGQEWIARSTYIPVMQGMEPDYSEVIDPEQADALREQTEYILEGEGYGGASAILNGQADSALADALAAVAAGTQTPEQAMESVEANSGC
jgi:raffinose/stachyose/melibiose transport system substrate-binding protein